MKDKNNDGIRWPGGSADFYKDIFRYRTLILNGTMHVVDPSSGGSSFTGFAVFHRRVLQCQGDIELDKRLKVNRRLQIIYDRLNGISPPADILIIEKLRGRAAPAQLLFSVGTAMSAVRAPICIEMPVGVWRAFAGKDYTDSKKAGQTRDSEDAVKMGLAAIHLALWGKGNEHT